MRNFDSEFPPDFPSTLSIPAREQFLSYAYISKETGNYILCTDDTRFFNHSETLNVIDTPSSEQEGLDIAARDIQPGEEILYNYNVFSEGAPS